MHFGINMAFERFMGLMCVSFLSHYSFCCFHIHSALSLIDKYYYLFQVRAHEKVVFGIRLDLIF